LERIKDLLRPLGPKVKPDLLWNSLRSPWTNRQASDLTFKMAHNGLYVGGRLAHAAGNPRLRRCFGCAVREQTHAHLFVECPTVCPLWMFLLDLADHLWPGAQPKFPLSWPAILVGLPLTSYQSKYHRQMWHGMVGEMKLAIYYAFQACAQEEKPFTSLLLQMSAAYRITTFIQIQNLHATQNNKHQDIFASTWLATDVVTQLPGGKCVVNL
jgi:hypothetical protein